MHAISILANAIAHITIMTNTPQKDIHKHPQHINLNTASLHLIRSRQTHEGIGLGGIPEDDTPSNMERQFYTVLDLLCWYINSSTLS